MLHSYYTLTPVEIFILLQHVTKKNNIIWALFFWNVSVKKTNCPREEA